MVDEAVHRHGFRGLKVHRHDARITREVCEAARAWRLPILYDVMGDVAGVGLIADEYPDVPFVIPHLGSFADDWRAQTAFVDQLVSRRNVFTDTSGVRRFDVLLDAVQRAGAGKVLFGTDGPWLHPGVELAKIRALRLPPREERLITSGNVLRLLRRAGARPVGPRARPRPGTSPAGAPALLDPRTTPDGDPWLQAGSAQRA
jgi:hypothetical protein